MPVYEYVCDDCSNHFEVRRPIKDADLPQNCDKCQSTKIHRAISLFYAQSGGRSLTTNNKGCPNCSGGSCGSCPH